MRNAIRFLFLGFLAAWAMGCAVADTGAFGRLSDEVGVLRKDVNTLRATSHTTPTGMEEVPGLRRTVADLGNDSDRLRSEQLVMSSRLEETQAELERTIRDNRRMADRMQELERRVVALEGGRQMGQVGTESRFPPDTALAPGASAGTDEWKSPEEMYEYAVGQVRAGSPKKGREVLNAFAAQYPEHKLLPNAFYWKGESYYAEKDYENAILSFQDVVDKYPETDKAPDAIYKQGLSFLALKDVRNAKILFNLVSTKYPNSQAAMLAKKQLSQVK